MSLDYVSSGEPVRASTINSLIDATHGSASQSPDLLVTSTRSGPQYVMPSQLGSVQMAQQSLFDVSNYTLSGWPMLQIQLGFSLEDALRGVRVHTEDGTRSATSAIVMSKNSASCPVAGGSISSHILLSNDFDRTSARGDTGWVKTTMEGVYGATVPSLQIWKTDNNIVELIANFDDDDLENELSSVLRSGGMEDSELSTLKFLDSWTLAKQTVKDGKTTAKTCLKHGIADTYSYSYGSGRGMLKAFLACYKAEKSASDTEKRDSDWTWMIPLGSGAGYKDSAEGAWTTQLAYGGDPIIVYAEKASSFNSLSSNFSGDPTFVESTPFGECMIAFGKFHSTSGDKIEPGQVWMDLSYEYDKWAVTAQINDGQGEPPQGQAVVGTVIKIAECQKYVPVTDVKVGDEAAAQYVFNGTLGDLFRGEPKLDTYTPVQSGVEYKSLEWTTRAKDAEGKNMGEVDCHCLQLHNFDSAQAVDPVVSSDMYVVRRFDNDLSSAEIVYLPVSTLSVTPDSDLSSSQMSSLQWRTVDTKVSSKLSDDDDDRYVDVLQAWNFDNIDDTYGDLCIALSGQQQHVMLRNASLSCVEYMQLSCLSVILDSQGLTGQKSLGWLESDTMVPEELQLWNFDQAEATAPTSSDMYLARRSTETGPELVYLPLQDAGVPPDSQLSDAQTSSLQWRVLKDATSSDIGKVTQSWQFDQFDEYHSSTAEALSSGEQHLFLRNASLSCVEYMALSALSTIADSQGGSGQKSLNWLSSDSIADSELQLYKFDEESEEAGFSVRLSATPKLLMDSEYEFVVRKGGAGGEVAYVQISAAASLSGGGGSGIEDLSAGSHNPNVQFDAQHQDYLSYLDTEGQTQTVALPYMNAVAELSVLSATGDRQLSWTYTRISAEHEPIDLGVEFTDEQESDSTGVHSKFVLKSASDSNVEFTFNGSEVQIGVYYI